MDISQDICSLDELKKNTKAVIQSVRDSNRPFMVTEQGKPGVIIIPANIMKSKLRALQAVCELSEV